MTLRTVLLSLQALLAAAEPDDPQDAVVANQVGVQIYMFFFYICRPIYECGEYVFQREQHVCYLQQ